MSLATILGGVTLYLLFVVGMAAFIRRGRGRSRDD